MSAKAARGMPVMVCAVLVLSAACSSRDEVDVRASALLTSQEVTLPTASLEPVVVPTDAGLFVVGGYDIDGEVLTPSPDVYFAAAEDDAWSRLAPPPFAGALYFPAVAPLEGGLLVVGVPCGPTSADSAVATCAANRLVAASYSNSEVEWQEIAVPEWLQIASGTSPILARNIGVLTNGSVVFLVGQGTSISYAMYDAVSDAWTRIDVPESLLSSGVVCVVNGALMVLSSDPSNPEGADPGKIDAAPIVVSTLQGTEWVVDKIDKPVGAKSERIICGGGAASYIGFDAGAHVKTVLWRDASGWTELSPPKIDDPTGLSVGRIRSAAFIHQRDSDGGMVHVFDADVNEWATQATIRGEAVAAGAALLVVGADRIEKFESSEKQ